MTALQQRDRRALLAGAGIIFILVLVVRAAPAWARWREQLRAEATESGQRLSETTVLIDSLPQMLDSLEARTRRVRTLSTQLIGGPSASEAAAGMTALIGEIARTSQMRLDVVTVRVDSGRSRELPSMTVEVQGIGDVTALATFLRDLEQPRQLLAVRRLSVRSTRPVASPAEAEQLNIRMSIEGIGFVRAPEAGTR